MKLRQGRQATAVHVHAPASLEKLTPWWFTVCGAGMAFKYEAPRRQHKRTLQAGGTRQRQGNSPRRFFLPNADGSVDVRWSAATTAHEDDKLHP